MTAGTETTVVIFRKWPASEGGGIIALFPYVPGTNDPFTCQSYEHVGQHGSADCRGVVGRTVPATPGEYAPLRRELESYPYDYRLAVRDRTPVDAFAVRAGQAYARRTQEQRVRRQASTREGK
jgi:hypothetical protein